MELNSQRMLGFAFAGADLLLEVAADGRIAFALGASETLAGSSEAALTGASWLRFMAPCDQDMIRALFDGLEEGARAGPVVIRLAGETPRRASLSAFRLPHNGGAISCALSRTASGGAEGLLDRSEFESLAARLADDPTLELALVELAGLSAAVDGAADQGEALIQRLTGVLRALSHRGEAAAGLGEDRYALVRPAGEAPETLKTRLKRLLPANVALEPAVGRVSLGGTAGARQALRALRFALSSFIEDGFAKAPPSDLAHALKAAVEGALDDARALSATIRNREFRLSYQPVVKLADGRVSHHEVLVRFGAEASPFPTIRAAEEMDLIEPLDLAILEEALKALRGNPALRLAVNVSGRTIGSDAFVERALELIAEDASVRGRLVLEITESAAIEDLKEADRRLQALRARGCEVCLDDFGAGAASLAYLQQLTVDILKIDGRYIRDLQHGGREAAFVKHLVNLCRELNVRTLAEMVETTEAEYAVRLAGVDYAQGWLYGAAADKPEMAVKRPAVRPALTRLG